MITSADVRDYMDGLLMEMQEVHGGWVALEARGVFYTHESGPNVIWSCYAKGSEHSPQCKTAEECVAWLKDYRSCTVKNLRREAKKMQQEAEELLIQAEQLEQKHEND